MNAEKMATKEVDRIQSLDVIRGFALLGILLLNILIFGLPYSVALLPGLAIESATDLFVWAIIDISSEGAMRSIFSMLFGAGAALFLLRDSDRGAMYFRRMTWLLIFGLFDIFVLMWVGDILVAYAVVGFLLYFFRNLSARSLSIWGLSLFLLHSTWLALGSWSLQQLGTAVDEIQVLEERNIVLSDEQEEILLAWEEYRPMLSPSEAEIEQEIAERSSSRQSAFNWHLKKGLKVLLEDLPSAFLWDALLMMVIGMALFKSGFLQGDYLTKQYVLIGGLAFLVGLTVNSWEVYRSINSDFDPLISNAFISPTYHVGRFGIAVGWISLLIILIKERSFGSFLAPVGRMALTNYLSQSFICALIFTEFGLGLFAELSRTELYPIVLAIWIFQIWFSRWWLERYYFGPIEWLWRCLTYLDRVNFARR